MTYRTQSSTSGSRAGGGRRSDPRRASETPPPAPASSNSTLEGMVQEWTSTLAREILGAICLWFGVNELIQPHLWTGYVPFVPATGTLIVVLVLLHGAFLFVLGVALVFGIAPRVAALMMGLLLMEIILDLTVGHGVNDIAVRDLGILGLSLAVIGSTRQRLMLTT